MKAGSRLEGLLERGEFVVTAEINPPPSADPAKLRAAAKNVAGLADAYNVTDNNRALVRMSSWAAAILLHQEGLEPIMQVVTRDRNRMALQSDILGASALGVRNVLCLRGDDPKHGNEPEAKAANDIGPEEMLRMFRGMRDDGKLLGGGDIEERPRLLLGATSNPFGGDYNVGADILGKRVEMGADFVQTQAIYDVAAFEQFMGVVRSRGLQKRVAIIGGVIPLKSAKMARYMVEKVPGIIIPKATMERMERAGDEEMEGIKVTLELLEELRGVSGLAGVHIMPVGWEKRLRDIVEGAGLHPRP